MLLSNLLLHLFFELLGRPVVQLHTQRKAHLGEDFLDFFQGLPSEVLRLQHLSFGLLNEFTDETNIRVLEAVPRAYRKLELVDAAKKILVEVLLFFVFLFLWWLEALLEVDEDRDLLF